MCELLRNFFVRTVPGHPVPLLDLFASLSLMTVILDDPVPLLDLFASLSLMPVILDDPVPLPDV